MDEVNRFRSSLGRVSREAIYPQLFGSMDRESGGLLIGVRQPSGSLPEVTAALEAQNTDQGPRSLTFTQRTWEDLFQRFDHLVDASDGEIEIVGWYHSHPTGRAYLSERDLFIHRSFFPSRFQVAQVVDLRRSREGLFSWAGNEIDVLFEGPINRD